jgi:hypothetical protein
VLAALMGILWPAPARAIPAFARKYETGCQTCHTVYPKLSPFGEAFRRRGYRFSGVDSDAVPEQPIPLGQEAQAKAFPRATWPGTLSAIPPVAVGFDGRAALHPDVRSGAGRADNGTAVTLRDLVGEVHLWAGGSYDDFITYLAEVTFSTCGGLDVETARVLFNDLVGPANLLNVVVGRGAPNLTSFGPNSSYVTDLMLPPIPVANLYAATTSTFALGRNVSGVELNGIAWGRLGWSLGLEAGTNVLLRPTENVYGHAGYKLGGASLDGASGIGAADSARPWADTALTLDVFGYHANSLYRAADSSLVQDTALVFGAALRGQFRTLELNISVYRELHNPAQAGTSPPGAPDGAGAWVHADELSWLPFPWLVAAVRAEYVRVEPVGAPFAWDLKLIPALTALIRPNLKLSLVAQFEAARGAPPAGWTATGAFAAPTAPFAAVGFENESVQLQLATAF